VGVSVDESRYYGAASQVDQDGSRAGQGPDLLVVADCEEASIGDGNGAGTGLSLVDRDNVAAVEDQFRRRSK
jgi:hypothetical protein